MAGQDKYTEEEDEFVEDIEGNECVYNMNMFCVLSWRCSCRNIVFGSTACYLHWIVHLFRFLPLLLVWCEVVVLVGILDEGAKIKYLTEHDKMFQFPRFIWSKNSPHAQCHATAKMKSWFQEQLQSDVVNCALFGHQLTNFSKSVSFGSNEFFDEYARINKAEFSEDLTYVLTHCFPWAYADLCVNILSARPDIEVAARAGLGGCNQPPLTWEKCAYRNCYLPLEAYSRFGGQNRLSADIWRNIVVPWEEIDELVVLAKGISNTNLIPQQREHRALFLSYYNHSETYHVYEKNSEFICWFMKQMMNRRKDFSSREENLSGYLFQKLHWVYALGIGETHIVEVIAIVFLSFYVYTTAMYDELMQLLYQLRAHSMFSGPTHVRRLLGIAGIPGIPQQFAREANDGPTEAASTFDAGDESHGGNGNIKISCGLVIRYLQVVIFGIYCDVFMSLRVIYYACMVQATAMLIGWDHGVMEVVIAALAITFLLEIDDKMMVFIHRRLELSGTHQDVFEGYKRIVGRILRQDNRSPFVELLFRQQQDTHDTATESEGKTNKSLNGAGLVRGGSSSQSSDTPSLTETAAKRQMLERVLTEKRDQKTQEQQEEELEDILEDSPSGHLTEVMVIRLTSLALLAGVLALHIAQTLQLSTKVGVSDEDLAVEAQNLLHVLETFQERIVPLSAGVLAAGCLGNILARGPAVLPAMIQLGFCLGWVVWAMYTGTVNGLLFDLWKWFDLAGTEGDNGEVMANFYGHSVLLCPWLPTSTSWRAATAFDVCLALHVLTALIAPAIALRQPPPWVASWRRPSITDSSRNAGPRRPRVESGPAGPSRRRTSGEDSASRHGQTSSPRPAESLASAPGELERASTATLNFAIGAGDVRPPLHLEQPSLSVPISMSADPPFSVPAMAPFAGPNYSDGVY